MPVRKRKQRKKINYKARPVKVNIAYTEPSDYVQGIIDGRRRYRETGMAKTTILNNFKHSKVLQLILS